MSTNTTISRGERAFRKYWALLLAAWLAASALGGWAYLFSGADRIEAEQSGVGVARSGDVLVVFSCSRDPIGEVVIEGGGDGNEDQWRAVVDAGPAQESLALLSDPPGYRISRSGSLELADTLVLNGLSDEDGVSIGAIQQRVTLSEMGDGEALLQTGTRSTLDALRKRYPSCGL